MFSIGSSKPTVAQPGDMVGWVLVWPSCATSSKCTAARFPLRAWVKARVPHLKLVSRWRTYCAASNGSRYCQREYFLDHVPHCNNLVNILTVTSFGVFSP